MEAPPNRLATNVVVPTPATAVMTYGACRGLAGHMKNNISCALYSAQSNSSIDSSSSSLPSRRVSAAVSSISGDAIILDGSGDEDDYGGGDDEEE